MFRSKPLLRCAQTVVNSQLGNKSKGTGLFKEISSHKRSNSIGTRSQGNIRDRISEESVIKSEVSIYSDISKHELSRSYHTIKNTKKSSIYSTSGSASCSKLSEITRKPDSRSLVNDIISRHESKKKCSKLMDFNSDYKENIKPLKESKTLSKNIRSLPNIIINDKKLISNSKLCQNLSSNNTHHNSLNSSTLTAQNIYDTIKQKLGVETQTERSSENEKSKTDNKFQCSKLFNFHVNNDSKINQDEIMYLNYKYTKINNSKYSKKTKTNKFFRSIKAIFRHNIHNKNYTEKQLKNRNLKKACINSKRSKDINHGKSCSLICNEIMTNKNEIGNILNEKKKDFSIHKCLSEINVKLKKCNEDIKSSKPIHNLPDFWQNCALIRNDANEFINKRNDKIFVKYQTRSLTTSNINYSSTAIKALKLSGSLQSEVNENKVSNDNSKIENGKVMKTVSMEYGLNKITLETNNKFPPSSTNCSKSMINDVKNNLDEVKYIKRKPCSENVSCPVIAKKSDKTSVESIYKRNSNSIYDGNAKIMTDNDTFTWKSFRNRHISAQSIYGCENKHQSQSSIKSNTLKTENKPQSQSSIKSVKHKDTLKTENTPQSQSSIKSDTLKTENKSQSQSSIKSSTLKTDIPSSHSSIQSKKNQAVAAKVKENKFSKETEKKIESNSYLGKELREICNNNENAEELREKIKQPEIKKNSLKQIINSQEKRSAAVAWVPGEFPKAKTLTSVQNNTKRTIHDNDHNNQKTLDTGKPVLPNMMVRSQSFKSIHSVASRIAYDKSATYRAELVKMKQFKPYKNISHLSRETEILGNNKLSQTPEVQNDIHIDNPKIIDCSSAKTPDKITREKTGNAVAWEHKKIYKKDKNIPLNFRGESIVNQYLNSDRKTNLSLQHKTARNYKPSLETAWTRQQNISKTNEPKFKLPYVKIAANSENAVAWGRKLGYENDLISNDKTVTQLEIENCTKIPAVQEQPDINKNKEMVMDIVTATVNETTEPEIDTLVKSKNETTIANFIPTSTKITKEVNTKKKGELQVKNSVTDFNRKHMISKTRKKINTSKIPLSAVPWVNTAYFMNFETNKPKSHKNENATVNLENDKNIVAGLEIEESNCSTDDKLPVTNSKHTKNSDSSNLNKAKVWKEIKRAVIGDVMPSQTHDINSNAEKVRGIELLYENAIKKGSNLIPESTLGSSDLSDNDRIGHHSTRKFEKTGKIRNSLNSSNKPCSEISIKANEKSTLLKSGKDEDSSITKNRNHYDILQFIELYNRYNKESTNENEPMLINVSSKANTYSTTAPTQHKESEYKDNIAASTITEKESEENELQNLQTLSGKKRVHTYSVKIQAQPNSLLEDDSNKKSNESRDKTVTNNDLTVTKNDLTVTKNDLTVTNNDLTATNNDLTATNNDLTATNNDLTATKNDLTAIKNGLTAIKNDLTATKNDLTATNNDLTATKNDLTATNNDLTATNNDLTATNNDLTATNNDLTVTNNSLEVNNDLKVNNEKSSKKKDTIASDSDNKSSNSLFTPFTQVINTQPGVDKNSISHYYKNKFPSLLHLIKGKQDYKIVVELKALLKSKPDHENSTNKNSVISHKKPLNNSEDSRELNFVKVPESLKTKENAKENNGETLGNQEQLNTVKADSEISKIDSNKTKIHDELTKNRNIVKEPLLNKQNNSSSQNKKEKTETEESYNKAVIDFGHSLVNRKTRDLPESNNMQILQHKILKDSTTELPDKEDKQPEFQRHEEKSVKVKGSQVPEDYYYYNSLNNKTQSEHMQQLYEYEEKILGYNSISNSQFDRKKESTKSIKEKDTIVQDYDLDAVDTKTHAERMAELYEYEENILGIYNHGVGQSPRDSENNIIKSSAVNASQKTYKPIIVPSGYESKNKTLPQTSRKKHIPIIDISKQIEDTINKQIKFHELNNIKDHDKQQNENDIVISEVSPFRENAIKDHSASSLSRKEQPAKSSVKESNEKKYSEIKCETGTKASLFKQCEINDKMLKERVTTDANNFLEPDKNNKRDEMDLLERKIVKSSTLEDDAKFKSQMIEKEIVKKDNLQSEKSTEIISDKEHKSSEMNQTVDENEHLQTNKGLENLETEGNQKISDHKAQLERNKVHYSQDNSTKMIINSGNKSNNEILKTKKTDHEKLPSSEQKKIHIKKETGADIQTDDLMILQNIISNNSEILENDNFTVCIPKKQLSAESLIVSNEQHLKKMSNISSKTHTIVKTVLNAVAYTVVKNQKAHNLTDTNVINNKSSSDNLSFSVVNSNTNNIPENETKEKESNKTTPPEYAKKRMQIMTINEIKFPLINHEKSFLPYPMETESNAIIKTKEKSAYKHIPSVSKILNETLPHSIKDALDKWKYSKEAYLNTTQRIEEYYKEQLINDIEFHDCIRRHILKTPLNLLMENANSRLKGLLKSLKNVFPKLSNVTALESPVVHSDLPYHGIVDCIACYDGNPVLIEWKQADQPKSLLDLTYDAPIQLSAYIGAVNHDKHYKLPIKSGMIIVAHTDGSPADEFLLTYDECQKYWKIWLERMEKYIDSKIN